VLASHRHSRGRSFIRFGTTGLGVEFIGTNEDPLSSPTGRAVFDVFTSFVKRKLNFLLGILFRNYFVARYTGRPKEKYTLFDLM
jgi:hypothetical protein